MNWAYELLGVAPDADATAIKRAYARLLRTTRPDEDAAAFQRLNTAYQMALAQAGKLAARPPLTPHPPRPTDGSAVARAARPITPAAPLKALKSAPPMAPKEPRALETLPPPETARPDPAPAPLEILKPVARAPNSPLPPSLEVLRPPALPPAPPIDVAKLAQHVIDEACHAEGPLTLAEWLAHCPELWSFRIKQLAGQLVLQRLAQEPRPMQAANFDALLGFFDLNNVLTGLNPVAVEQLRNRLTVHWERQNDHASLARRVGMLANGQPQTWRVRTCIDLLKQPRRLGSTIATALTRGQAIQLARIVHILSNAHLEQLPADIDHKHARFWLRAVGPSGSSPEQLTTSAIRVLAFVFSCTLATIILALIVLGRDISDEWRSLRLTLIFLIIGVLLGWAFFQASSWIDRWQSQPEMTTTRRPWLRRLFIPAISTAGFTTGCTGGALWIAWGIVLGVLLLALRRFDRRTRVRTQKPAIKLNSIALAVGLPMLAAIAAVAAKEVVGSINLPLLTTAFAITLLVWGIDMWRHRAQWRAKQIRT